MSQKNAAILALAAVLLAAVAAGCTSSSPGVKTGDNVTIDYIVNASNGTMLSTSYAQLAKDLGVYDASGDYTPFRFMVGDPGMLTGVNEAVIGMKVNETKTVSVPPEKAYGRYNKSLIVPINLRELTEANITPSVGQLIPTLNGWVRVASIDVDNNTVYIDFNRQYAGETLVYQITVRKIE